MNKNMVNFLFIDSFNGYRLDLPYTLSCMGPRTQLQTTRPLRTQLQSLSLPYDPQTHFTLKRNHLDFSYSPLFYLSYPLYLKPRSIYTIPWSADHG